MTTLYACNSENQHTFKQETSALVAENGWQSYTWYLNEAGSDFSGELNLALVSKEIPLSSGDFYICGPVGFMEAVVKQLEALGVERDRIHYEVFGPHAYL